MPGQVVTKVSRPQHPVWVPGQEGNDATAPREPWGWDHVQHPHQHPLRMSCQLERAPPGTLVLNPRGRLQMSVRKRRGWRGGEGTVLSWPVRRQRAPRSSFILPMRPGRNPGNCPQSQQRQHHSFVFWEQLLESGIPKAGGYSRDWRMIGASSVKQLWKLAEKCETSELLRRFGQMW